MQEVAAALRHTLSVTVPTVTFVLLVYVLLTTTLRLADAIKVNPDTGELASLAGKVAQLLFVDAVGAAASPELHARYALVAVGPVSVSTTKPVAIIWLENKLMIPTIANLGLIFFMLFPLH